MILIGFSAILMGYFFSNMFGLFFCEKWVYIGKGSGWYSRNAPVVGKKREEKQLGFDFVVRPKIPLLDNKILNIN